MLDEGVHRNSKSSQRCSVAGHSSSSILALALNVFMDPVLCTGSLSGKDIQQYRKTFQYNCMPLTLLQLFRFGICDGRISNQNTVHLNKTLETSPKDLSTGKKQIRFSSLASAFEWETRSLWYIHWSDVQTLSTS